MMNQSKPFAGLLVAMGLLLSGVSFATGNSSAHASAEAVPEKTEQQLAPAADPPPKQLNTETSEPDSADTRAIDSLARLLQTRSEKTKDLAVLRRKLRDKKDENSQAEELREELRLLEEQISALSTGLNDADFDLAAEQKIDLDQEFQQLVQPFVMMLRAATDNARQIEDLRRDERIAKRHRGTAKAALENIEPLLALPAPKAVREELLRSRAEWQDRLKAADDLVDSTQRQLEQKLTQQRQPNVDAGSTLSGFVAERGLNLMLGLLAFLVALSLLYSIGAGIRLVYRKFLPQTRSIGLRVLSLLYGAASLVVASSMMLVVFNLRNDWVLLGLSMLMLLTLSWFAIRSLPSILDQIVLYLDLGAVQERERLMFNGVPWRVKRLGFHCHLENPSLAGGEFSMPIRELIGLHSRPTVGREPWFPTEMGDWVMTDDGLAQVVIQSPGLVQLRLDGGILKTIPTADFFANAPDNLSHGSRAEIVFGISYKHQDISTAEFRNKLAEFIREGLRTFVSAEHLIRVGVDVLSANESSIDYEVEADIAPAAAPQYEDIERALAALCIDACNHYGWEIPYPQLVLHNANQK